MCKLSLVCDICPDFYTGHNPDETKLSLLWRRFPPLKWIAMKNTCFWLVWTCNILGQEVFFDKCSFFKTRQFRPFLNKKKIVRTKRNYRIEMKKLMANHLVLMPEFPETKSRVFRSIPQIRMNTSWTLASALGAGHTMIVDAVLFWNSSVLESLRLMTKNTYLSLG